MAAAKEVDELKELHTYVWTVTYVSYELDGTEMGRRDLAFALGVEYPACHDLAHAASVGGDLAHTGCGDRPLLP